MHVYESNNSGPFVILCTDGYRAAVKFINTGTIDDYSYEAVCRGKIRDPMHPSLAGVGYVGIGKHKATYTDGKKQVQTPAYAIWHSMISRCYGGHIKHQAYSDVTVDDRWHNFQNFCNDLPSLPGYQRWADYHAGASDVVMHIDKDTRVPGARMYGPNTCQFLTASQNCSAPRRKTDGTYTVQLTDSQRKEIIISTLKAKELAQQYGCSISTIYKIRKENAQ
ncbi:MAG: hypothetical protein ACRCXB_26590 [Aeromonadaceae bacterium]